MSLLICDQPILANLPSPFERIVAFDYQDGPMTGVVQCTSCALAYRFECLSIDVDGVYDYKSWDRGEELRGFSLAPLEVGVFERIVERLSAIESPRWPVWVPGMPVRSENLDQIFERDIDPLVSQAGRAHLIVAASGLLRPIVAVHGFDHRDGLTGGTWFSWLGLVPDTEAVLSEAGRF